MAGEVGAQTVARKEGRKTNPESCHVPTRKSAWAEAYGPSVTLPIRFILTGVLSLILGVGWLVARPEVLTGYHYHQEIIALTHLFVLGFGCSVVMGAMYQMTPVVLEMRLFSEALGRWHFPLHLVGLAGMVWMFFIWNMKWVGVFGSLFGLGTALFIYNISRTMGRLPRSTVFAKGLCGVMAWLGTTVLAGWLLTASKIWMVTPFDPIAAMHAHAHAGILGVFIMVIVVVSFKVVPLFALSETQSTRRQGWTLLLMNLGLAGVFYGILRQSSIRLFFGSLILCGLVFFGLEIRAMLHARKRTKLDWGLRYLVAALWLLAPLSILGMILAWPGLPWTAFTGQLETAYAMVAILGVVGLAVLGMLHRILSFLVWYRSYARWVGRAEIPSLSDMYSVALQKIVFGLYLTALIGLTFGVLLERGLIIRCGAMILFTAILCFVGNMGRILSHWSHPRIRPGSHPSGDFPQSSGSGEKGQATWGRVEANPRTSLHVCSEA